jgi:hypothetical protein
LGRWRHGRQFSTANNWDLSGAPANNGSANVLFAGVMRTTPNLDVSLRHSRTRFCARQRRLYHRDNNGSTLTIRGGGIDQNDDSLQVINVPVVFATTSSITANGNLHLAGGVALDQSIIVSGSMTTTLERVTGSGRVTKLGTGSLNFIPATAIQQYSLTIGDGTVSYSNAANGVAFRNSVALNGGTLSVMTDLTLSGGQFTRESGATFTLQNGRTMAIRERCRRYLHEPLPDSAVRDLSRHGPWLDV